MTKDDVFALGPKTAEVTFQGRTFRVREMIGDEFGTFQAASTVKDAEGKPVGFKGDWALAVQLATVGEDGERLFAEDDLPRLRKLNSVLLVKLSEKIAELSGVGEVAGND